MASLSNHSPTLSEETLRGHLVEPFLLKLPLEVLRRIANLLCAEDAATPGGKDEGRPEELVGILNPLAVTQDLRALSLVSRDKCLRTAVSEFLFRGMSVTQRNILPLLGFLAREPSVRQVVKRMYIRTESGPAIPLSTLPDDVKKEYADAVESFHERTGQSIELLNPRIKFPLPEIDDQDGRPANTRDLESIIPSILKYTLGVERLHLSARGQSCMSAWSTYMRGLKDLKEVIIYDLPRQMCFKGISNLMELRGLDTLSLRNIDMAESQERWKLHRGCICDGSLLTHSHRELKHLHLHARVPKGPGSAFGVYFPILISLFCTLEKFTMVWEESTPQPLPKPQGGQMTRPTATLYVHVILEMLRKYHGSTLKTMIIDAIHFAIDPVPERLHTFSALTYIDLDATVLTGYARHRKCYLPPSLEVLRLRLYNTVQAKMVFAAGRYMDALVSSLKKDASFRPHLEAVHIHVGTNAKVFNELLDIFATTCAGEVVQTSSSTGDLGQPRIAYRVQFSFSRNRQPDFIVSHHPEMEKPMTPLERRLVARVMEH